MKKHPILFTGPMIRAILDGRKTQTRRLLKLPTQWSIPPARFKDGAISRWGDGDINESIRCRWQPGDQLWVKETFAAPWGEDYKFPSGESGIFYRADNPENFPDDGSWTPSIFMPERLSRITLDILKVRVEKLQDISSEDAKAEGVTTAMCEPSKDADDATTWTYAQGYKWLWESINGKGSWNKNPFVWVLEFKRIKP